MKRIVLTLTSLPALLAVHAPALAAQCGDVTTSIDYGCGQSGNHGLIFDWLLGITRFLGGLVGLVVMLMLIIAGVQYITAGGNPQGVAAAKKRIGGAVTALVLYILMFGILQWLIPGGIFK